MRKRAIEIKFRLSPEEAALLHTKQTQAGMSRNAFLVELIGWGVVYPAGQLRALNQEYAIMNRLLRGMATNLNQLAKIANATHSLPAASLLLELSQEVRVLQNNLAPLWEETRRHLWRS